MNTYHIHITGLVQGVGFRPYVYRLARKAGLTGWVSNTPDGVHIEINADVQAARSFYENILGSPPVNAVITSHTISEVPNRDFASFSITTGKADTKTDLLLTPDIALCEDCRHELMNNGNRRFHYPFTTCLACGPRYSITRQLPYERYNTTMASLEMCTGCRKEYDDVNNRRYYSQTNSCSTCAIPMQLHASGGNLISNDPAAILEKLNQALQEGAIAAVKGIGGYLLLCDAGNEASIQTLRSRKKRPAKPFALLYSGMQMMRADLQVSVQEETELNGPSAPIVLCRWKESRVNGICTELIAPGLDKAGAMLPGTALLQLISSAFRKPLIATSANISGSPIIYRDEDAMELLNGIADLVLSYSRDILIPQDDSVVQFTESGEKIILRRSRGLAPNYFPNPFSYKDDCIIAMGAELKSAFAIQHGGNLYVSQYLGNQENLASQEAFAQTSAHLLNILQAKPSVILADNHPGYFVTQLGNERAIANDIPFITLQHHKAHFAAVLAEHGLLQDKEPVLGVIWDGAGLGDDGQVWGGEFFVSENNDISRLAHLDYFPQLLGDKMNREPRLSALSLMKYLPARQHNIQQHFSLQEWQYYQQLMNQPSSLLTSSMGRLMDGIASITGICQLNSYEGEAAMKLEALARSYRDPVTGHYPIPLLKDRLDFTIMLEQIIEDLDHEAAPGLVAKKFFLSLAVMIGQVSDHFGINKIAFSGGVFQNALLNDMLNVYLQGKKQLFRHRQLSPNDECIGFGQLALYHKTNELSNNKVKLRMNKLQETVNV